MKKTIAEILTRAGGQDAALAAAKKAESDGAEYAERTVRNVPDRRDADSA